jgi:hypothetical protein
MVERRAMRSLEAALRRDADTLEERLIALSRIP